MADFEAPAPAHAHAHGGGEAEHSHEHANSHEHAHHDGDGGREHAHLHEHVDVSQLVLHQEAAAAARPKEPFVAPADRLIIPADAFEFSEVDEEVRYTGTSGLKITQITGLEPLKHLQTLVLRSCLISDMGAVSAHAPTLRHLELYDNQLKSLKGAFELFATLLLELFATFLLEIFATFLLEMFATFPEAKSGDAVG
ncbi:hypothetical protein M885DRAFT_13005 [Pelagophyceae sp. CCMP2097]|nr:hypothetical protein M885DRAFT_13005 [Pelagophyceae sp. CCMP2097]